MEWKALVTSSNWQQIETVLLDMDGTLLDLEFDNYFWLELIPREYAKKHDISEITAKNKLTKLFAHYQGSLQWYCIDFWSEKLALDIAEIKSSIAERVEYRKGTLEFLRGAKEQHKTIYLVTNAHPDTLAIKLKQKDFSWYFRELLSSHQTSYPKESNKFWQAIESRWNFDKKTTLFVDDSIDILQAARNFGIEFTLGVSSPDSSKPMKSYPSFESINQLDEILNW
ncbi:GMP/IMP nucleotidase [Kangiella sp. HZ709]|nr:GMP/IMP nucleotidase [Kangiella sp. HZ709]MRX28227.1 GMP/IMP nucleotidase [Kangiella sp. HZ709]